jgi:hypothetical protein
MNLLPHQDANVGDPEQERLEEKTVKSKDMRKRKIRSL